MASTLADLAIRITAQDEASATVNSMGAKIKQQIGDISKLAAGLALGNLGANIGMDIAQRLKSAAEQIDTFGTAVRNVQVVTGASAESTSAMVAVFEHFGLSGEDAASKLSRFERALTGTDSALDLTASGGKRGQQILKELGVSYEDAQGKVLPMDQVLMNLAERWQTLDAASKNAAARGLFGGLGGGGANQLNLILDQGKTGLQGLIDMFQKEGLILSQENVDDVTKFTYAHKAMDDSFKGLAITLGTAFMPAITATAAVISVLTQKVVSDLVPAIKGWPDFIGPATLAIVGLGIGMQILGFIVGPILSPIRALIGLILGHAAAATAATPPTVALAVAEATAGTAAGAATVPTAALAVAQTSVAETALVATGILDQYGNMIMRDGALAAVASGETATLATAEVEAGAAGTVAAGGIGAMTTAVVMAVGPFLMLGAAIYTFSQPLRDALGTIAELKAAIANIPEDQMTPLQKAMAGIINAVPTDISLGSGIGLPQNIKDEIAKTQADIQAQVAANTPTIPTGVDAGGGGSDTASVTAAKAAKTNADAALKSLQDAMAIDKDKFELSQVGAQTAALQAKLTADEATNNGQLLGYKRQIEDLDANAVNYALKRQQLNEQDAVTVAKMAEDKLKANSDDLDYQEKLLVAQARATRAAGGSVDMGALRQQVLAIREQQIQNEPGLLIAGHNTALADRAKSATDAQSSLQGTALDRAKLTLQEAMQPLEQAAVVAKRASEDQQSLLTLEKQRFDLAQQTYQVYLLTAQIAGKQADASLASAQAGLNAAGGSGTAPYGPLAARAAGGGVTVTINQQNSITSETDALRLAQATADLVWQQANAATSQQGSTTPASSGLPGAFAAATP